MHFQAIKNDAYLYHLNIMLPKYLIAENFGREFGNLLQIHQSFITQLLVISEQAAGGLG